MDNTQYIPYRELSNALNISNGDTVLLTSDILKLAMISRKKEKEFSALSFLDSFLEAVGTDGTLMIPSYNFDLETGDAYDALKTTPMTGSLAIAALNSGAYERTYNPMHSFLIKGNESDKLTGMKNNSSFGLDSPFSWMLENNALMIFAGTSPGEAMTFTHFVEESEQVWYRKYRKRKIHYTDSEGNASIKTFRIYAKKPGWTMKLERLQELLPPEIMNTFMLNGIPFYTLRCRDVYEFISKDIRENNASSIAGFSMKLYVRDIIKSGLKGFNLFRTTYGKIRSAKRTY